MKMHTLRLYEGDFDELQALFPESGAGPVIRRLLQKFLADFRDKPAKKAKMEFEL